MIAPKFKFNFNQKVTLRDNPAVVGKIIDMSAINRWPYRVKWDKFGTDWYKEEDLDFLHLPDYNGILKDMVI